MPTRSTDELLDGLSFRDFLVLVARASGVNPSSPRMLLRLRRPPGWVRSADRRLADRGLLADADPGWAVTPDGVRAARTGAVLFELEAFEP